MRGLLARGAFALALLFAGSASAQTFPEVAADSIDLITQINGSTTASTRTTGCIDIKGAKFLVLDYEVTITSTTTLTTTTCNHYRTAACTDTIAKKLLSCTGNVCAAASPQSPAISATIGYSHRFDVAGFWFAKCSVAFANGAAGDTIVVKSLPTRE